MSNLLKHNTKTIYSDVVQDKDIIYSHLLNKIEFANQKNNSIVGSKNLIYFSISSNENYISLLELSLKSIVKFTPIINFDVLFITQKNFIEKIQSISCISNFNVKYHIIPIPDDGISASINKIKIFDYENINYYKKILYLDCDIVCVKPLNELFDIEFDSRYIQVASNPEITHASWDVHVMFFGLSYLSYSQKEYIELEKPVPFNAGQFMFYNTEQMKFHFENLRWLVDVWPGPYFFEQSFMNFYFSLHGLVDKKVLHIRTSFVMILPFVENKDPSSKYIKKIIDINGKKILKVTKTEISSYDKEFIENYSVEKYHMIHFIGMALEASKKIKFANKFLELKNICL